MWAVLLVTLPTKPNAVRVRVWRTLKALGAAALRDGTHLLPLAQAAAFDAVVDEVHAHGGTASVFELDARNETQRAELLALFDRGEAYGEWRQSARALQADLDRLDETEARRRWRAVNDAFEALGRVDYYPGAARSHAGDELQALRQAIDARFSRGEPNARSESPQPRLDPVDFRGKRWATRRRPWVDRLACAWLVRRFIDPEACFVWLDDKLRVPRGAIGFDFDGARFTHVGARVTFEVMAASFGLDQDPRLQRIAAVVHLLDVGGIPVPEAAGLEAVLAGLRELHADDDALIDASGAIFDALLAAPPEAAR